MCVTTHLHIHTHTITHTHIYTHTNTGEGNARGKKYEAAHPTWFEGFTRAALGVREAVVVAAKEGWLAKFSCLQKEGKHP